MKIPENIKIGGFNCPIIYKKLDEKRGEYEPELKVIHLDTRNKKQIMESTFIHECIEAINEIYQLNLPHKSIDILEAGIYQIFKDNKLSFK